MNGNPGANEAAVENGNLLQLGEQREIAIYLRDGVAWVADFRGARGELFTAREWFALNGCSSLLRRAGRASIEPLPARAIDGIERLHGARDRAPLTGLGARPRDRLAGFSREFSCRTAVSVLEARTQRS
jgi:hypothetical protein